MRRFMLDADLLVGWIGLTYDSKAFQPDQLRSRHPFFGIGEYYARGTRTPSDLSIYANSPNHPETVLDRTLDGSPPWVKYMMKFAIERNPNTRRAIVPSKSGRLVLTTLPNGVSKPAVMPVRTPFCAHSEPT